jgi:hypothetical protein
LLRKFLNYSSIDLKLSLVDDNNQFLKWNEDHEIQRKIDQFGAGGTNLLDPKCGTSYYKRWYERKEEEAEVNETYEDVKEDMEYKQKIFDIEVARIVSLDAVNAKIKETKIK